MSSRPRGPWATFAHACVATAPTPASAHGTTDPAARNFDATATPHSARARSQATTENVERLSTVGEAAQVELTELTLLWRDEHARHFGSRQRTRHRLGVRRPDDDGPAPLVRFAQSRVVLDVGEDERFFERNVVLAFDRDLGNTASRG